MSGFGVIFSNYIRRALAYRWLVLVPTVLVFALVTLFVTIQPDNYESYAVLMPPIAKPGDSATRRDSSDVARDMFRSATERLLSTNTLMEVAEKNDPYPRLREERGMAAVVETLRKRIRIELNRNTGFTILSEPEVARIVEQAGLTDKLNGFYQDWLNDQWDIDEDFLKEVASKLKVDGIVAGGVDVWYQDTVDITEEGTASTHVGLMIGLFDGSTGKRLWLGRDENSAVGLRAARRIIQ